MSSVRLGLLLCAGLVAGAGRVAAGDAGDLDQFHLLRNWMPTEAAAYEDPVQLLVADLDGLGRDEIATGHRAWWQVYGQNGDVLDSLWCSLPEASDITDLRAVDRPGSAALDLVLSAGGALRIYDPVSKQLLRSIATDAPAITAFLVADVDGGSDREALVCDAEDLRVYSYETGELRTTKWGFGCTGLDLGQMDDDPQPELLLAGNSVSGLVLDGASLTVDWAWLDGFGAEARFLQADADPYLEILAPGASYLDTPRVLDVQTNEPLWSLDGVAAGSPIAVGDLDGDGVQEVLLGSSDGAVLLFDALSGESEGTIERSPAVVLSVALGETDGDGGTEVVWFSAVDFEKGAEGALAVASGGAGPVEASTPMVGGGTGGLTAGDLAGAGRLSVATTESDGYWGPGILRTFDVATGRQSWVAEVDGSPNVVRSSETDGDPQRELCAGGFGGYLSCHDGLDGEEAWQLELPHSITALDVVDVAGDLEPEVVAGSFEGNSEEGPFVYAVGANFGILRWRTADIANPLLEVFDVVVAGDVDGDDSIEVVALSFGYGLLAVFDGETGGLEHGLFELGASLGMNLAQVDADPVLELVVVSSEGLVTVVDPLTGQTTATLADLALAPYRFTVADVTRDGVADLVYADPFRVRVWDLAAGSEIWQSPDVGGVPYARDAMAVTDADANGVPEISVKTDFGFVVFESPYVSVFVDGFESGDTGAWSATWP